MLYTHARCGATVTSALLGLLLLCGPAARAQGNLSPAAIFRNAKPSVVLIYGGDTKGDLSVQGSGFIIAPNEIVTNHHVVAGASAAMIVFSDGATAPVTDVVVDSARIDLIVLSATTGQRPALRLGDELSLQQGDPVYAIGAPEGLELTLTNGIISAFRNIQDQFLIQSTAAIGHGSSGGPLLDHEGLVVGVTSALLSDTAGIYFSVGAGDLKRMLRTPAAVLLSFAEWASENASAAAPADKSESSSSNTSGIDAIEQLLSAKKFDQARSAIDTWSSQHPDETLNHRLSGELDVRTGDTADALKELGGYVRSEPKDAMGQFYYALALYQERDFAEALQHEQQSNELAPAPSDQTLLALLYYATRDYPHAESAARTALNSDRQDTTALDVLAGVAYHRAGTWTLYVSDVNTLEPNSLWVHLSRALDAYNQNQVETAIREFTAAEQADFPESVPYYLLGTWYEKAGELGPANDQITAGLASVPSDPQLLYEGMYISLRTHDNTEAGRRFLALQQAYPNTLTEKSAGCLYYYGIGQAADALPYCASQVSLDPNNHTAYSNYGWSALDANQFPLAQQEFGQAYKIALPKWSQLNKTEIVDLLWGFTIAQYYSGQQKDAHNLLKVIRKSYPDAATITGLQQMPLLWSDTTISRIETILMEFPR